MSMQFVELDVVRNAQVKAIMTVEKVFINTMPASMADKEALLKTMYAGDKIKMKLRATLRSASLHITTGVLWAK